MKKWTQESVIQMIKERAEKGLPLNSADVSAQDESLFGAGRRTFKSWGKAVEVAGFDYKAISLEARRRPRNPKGTWTEELITEKIKERYEAGQPLNPHTVQGEDSKLYAAAAATFGSWGKAIEAMGIDYLEHRKTSDWTADKLTNKIKDLHRRGADLSDNNVSLLAPSIYGAATVHFGSWKKAIEAAGIQYIEVSRTDKWSREKIRNIIRSMVENGEKINRNNLPSSIYDYYKNFEEALKDAGIEMAEGDIKIPDNCIRKIRELRGMSQEELGNIVGCSHRQIGLIELKQIDPKIAQLLKIASALNVTVDELYRIND